ncbi:hypothetical protein ANTPLA_LOCUS5947 [Anthophora plagiata]
MSRSSTLCEFVTPIINGQPTSRFVPVTARSPVLLSLESKNTRNGWNDELKNPLVSRCDSGEYEIIEMRQKRMESVETTHLLCGKSIYKTFERFGGSRESREDTESASNDFRQYTIDPICMNIRIFVFWFLWAMLVVVLVISVLSYCCLETKTCRSSKEAITLNETSIVSNTSNNRRMICSL